MNLSNEELFRRKREILFPYLPFINNMISSVVKGTGMETKWRTMYECITSDKKRMSLEQIQKMEQTLSGLQNNLQHKQDEPNDSNRYHQQSSSSHPSTSRQSFDTDFRRQNDLRYRNPSPTPPPRHYEANTSTSYRNEDRERESSYYSRQNDNSRFNDSRQYQMHDNSSSSPSPWQQNRSFDTRRKFDDGRNFNNNPYDQSQSRSYERAQSRPLERGNFRGSFRGNSRGNFRGNTHFKSQGRAESRPFERSQSKPSENVKVVSKTQSDDNFLTTHPKFLGIEKSNVDKEQKTSEKIATISKESKNVNQKTATPSVVPSTNTLERNFNKSVKPNVIIYKLVAIPAKTVADVTPKIAPPSLSNSDAKKLLPNNLIKIPTNETSENLKGIKQTPKPEKIAINVQSKQDDKQKKQEETNKDKSLDIKISSHDVPLEKIKQLATKTEVANKINKQSANLTEKQDASAKQNAVADKEQISAAATVADMNSSIAQTAAAVEKDVVAVAKFANELKIIAKKEIVAAELVTEQVTDEHLEKDKSQQAANPETNVDQHVAEQKISAVEKLVDAIEPEHLAKQPVSIAEAVSNVAIEQNFVDEIEKIPAEELQNSTIDAEQLAVAMEEFADAIKQLDKEENQPEDKNEQLVADAANKESIEHKELPANDEQKPAEISQEREAKNQQSPAKIEQPENAVKIANDSQEKTAATAKPDVSLLDDSDLDVSDIEEEPENIDELWAKLNQKNSNLITVKKEQETSLSTIQETLKTVDSQKVAKPAEAEQPIKEKRTRKKMNELEKLQEDLSRSIDCDSFITTSIKPRTCTLQKPVDDKTKECKPCTVKLIRLNLESIDMPVKLDADFEKRILNNEVMLPKVKKPQVVAKKKGRKPKVKEIPELIFNIKPEPEPFTPVVVEQIKEPEPVAIKPEKITPEKRKISEDEKEVSEPKKIKICEDDDDEWIAVPSIEKAPKHKTSMKLKRFKTLFDIYSADYDKKHFDILKLRKMQRKKRKPVKKEISQDEDEPVDVAEVSKESIEVKQIVKVEEPVEVEERINTPPPLPSISTATPENISNQSPIVVRNQGGSQLKIVAVKPLPRVETTSSILVSSQQRPPTVVRTTKLLIVSPTQPHQQQAPAATPPRAIKPLPEQSKLPANSSVKVVGRIVPAQSTIGNPTIVNLPATSSLRISSVTSEQTRESSRVGKIPITLPSAAAAEQQQPIEVIDISDEDDDDDITEIDTLRPWIEQPKLKSKKNSKACKAMINKHGLAALYKCMSSTCCFYTSEKDYFQIHLELHRDHQLEDAPNYLLCSYCEHRANDISGLIAHINVNHGGSVFSCNYCFFRSLNEFQVTLNHFQKYHSNEMKVIIAFDAPVKKEKNFDVKHVKQTIGFYCQPLTCIYCTKNFYIISAFADHLKSHPEKNLTKCMKCNDTADAANILMHYFNCYGFGLFQCVYCSFGTSTVTLIDEHLTNKHPDRTTYFVSRNIAESSNNRKNPSDISCLSLKEINKEPADDSRFEKIFIVHCELMRNSKNLGNLSDESVESSEEEENNSQPLSSASSLMIENVLSLNTEGEN